MINKISNKKEMLSLISYQVITDDHIFYKKGLFFISCILCAKILYKIHKVYNELTGMVLKRTTLLKLGKGTYRKMSALRHQYPGLKVLLAIGGWNEGSANYSALAASPQRRNVFVASVVDFLR